MRHAALDFARRIDRLGASADVVFCTDMVSVAELRGLTVSTTAAAPHVLYFHENQLTYPQRTSDARDRQRDLHFSMSNVISAAAADEVWFNSAFHRDEMLRAVPELLFRMPDFRQDGLDQQLRARSRVEWPGVEDMWSDAEARACVPGPLRVVWVGRWEHDKGPETFFAALDVLRSRGVEFRVSVLGARYREAPDCFDAYRARHPETIAHWGFLERRDDYARALRSADVVVSTARHEFFGIGVVEALLAGALPLLPDRLSYPELLGLQCDDDRAAEDRRESLAALERLGGGLFEGGAVPLAGRLERLARRKQDGDLKRGLCRVRAQRFSWPRRTDALDEALEAAARGARESRR